MKKLFIPFALALLMFASCGNDENENGEDNRTPGIIDMTSMTADEVKAAIKADLDAGVKEFKLTGEFSKIGIPVEVSMLGIPDGQPFFKFQRGSNRLDRRDWLAVSECRWKG